ncbi:hypothetical protein Q433_11270 [Bacillus subtilis subsp. subtilis str. OH 131.1]|nr:hypothetical protein Q433_11270 [Bacillus subtilis subsp. subtilis str. OH 131.1]
MVNQPFAGCRFFNGEELAVVHKTTGKRINVNVKMMQLPDDFTLQLMYACLWSEIVECIQLLVFDQ